MSVELDFDIIVPKNALHVADEELLPLFKDYLRAVGISDPKGYDYYQIRLLIRPRNDQGVGEDISFFERLQPRGRRNKRHSFASADSLFITMEVADCGIVLRETFPPTTWEDGQMEFTFSGTAGIGAGVNVNGVKAVADLQASLKKQFQKKKLAIIAQKTNALAIWDFRRPWIEKSNQPELHIMCSVPKDLPEDKRYIRCQRRVTQKGRAILAPREAKKILLPKAN